MVLHVTMLELIATVSECAETEAEVIATVVHMVNTGIVRLAGNFRGCTFTSGGELSALAA